MKMSNKAIANNVRNSIDVMRLVPQEDYVERVSKAGASAVRGAINNRNRSVDQKELGTAFARRYAVSSAKAGQSADQRPLFAIAMRDSERLEAILERVENTAKTFQDQAEKIKDLASMSEDRIIDLIMESIMNAEISTEKRREWLQELKWGMKA